MNPLRINVDPELLETGKYGAGALVRIERSSTGGGAGYAEIGTAPLVANQLVVEYDDATGTTSHWYRTRYSNSTNTAQSEYGPEFQPVTPSAYATVEDFTDTFEIPPVAARVRRIAGALEEASAMIGAAIGWDFYRHPATGTEQRTYDVQRNTRRLCVHGGVVSLTSVEVRYGPDDAWQTVDTDDWNLDPRNPMTGEAAGHVALTGDGAWPVFPAGVATVRLTGAFGYAAVPVDVRRATVALARQIYRADATTPGGLAGPDEWGGGQMPRGWPDDAYRVVDRFRRLYWCHI